MQVRYFGGLLANTVIRTGSLEILMELTVDEDISFAREIIPIANTSLNMRLLTIPH